MKSTPNYNLVKQELTDAADITQISGNWDKLDTTLKNLDDNKFNKTGGTISGQVTVTGRSNFYSVQVTDTETVGGTLTVGGKVTANGGLGVSGGATVDSLTATGDVTVNGKINTDNIRARGTALNAGVTMSGSDFVGVIAQVVSGTTPRISVSHHPDKTSNDKQIATTNWVKSLTATTSEYGLVKVADETALLSESNDAALTVDKAYELNDFRRMNKAYVVGDKVNCAFRFEWFLECIQAGTTSAESLDTRNVTFGQEIEDGTVKWIVRAHVKSVNNNVPDANGNITVETGGVKTVNGNEPDEAGNITPAQMGCLPLSGGTMTGNIRFTNGAYITELNGSEYKSIDVANNGWAAGGAGLTLRKADSPKESGQFGLMASNGTQTKTLIGTPGGSLMWNGVQLVRSVNGTNADSNGNITLNLSSFTFDGSLNGWYRDDKTGFMIQWGEIAATTGNNRYNFARSFPNYLLSISVQSVTKPTNPYKCVFIVSSYDKNGFNGGNDDTSTTAKYIAIGY